MGGYFSKQMQGGKINSMISNQDSLAAIYAIEQLNNPDIFDFGIKIIDFSVQCETEDDICIVNKEYKIFIQVKSGRLLQKEFYKVLDKFCNLGINESRQLFFVLVIFENFTVKGRSVPELFDDYRKIFSDPNETQEKKNCVKDELVSILSLEKYVDILDKLRIIRRPLFRDDRDVPAVFSRYLRLAYGFKNQKEFLITNVYNELIAEIEKQRRNRGFISKETIEIIIGKNLVKDTPFNGLDLMVGYEKVKNGYIKKTDKKLTEFEWGRNRAIRNIYKDWRKAYWKEFLISMLLSAKRCPECGHPMLANMCGMFGIACPDCGYTPYVTVFSFCDCGNYEVIKGQPELIDSKILTYINEFYTYERRCKKCNRVIADEYAELRVLLMPIPYPFNLYKNMDSIYLEKDNLN